MYFNYNMAKLPGNYASRFCYSRAIITFNKFTFVWTICVHLLLTQFGVITS